MKHIALLLLCACSTPCDASVIRDPYQENASHYARDCSVTEDTDGNRELVCAQRPHVEGALRIACVGDSITAVGHTSSVAHHWPDQLQDILDARKGNATYSVTNLGVCGSTCQKKGRLPWWSTGAYNALASNRWDIVLVMLGTNDAAPMAQGYWPADNHEHCDNATTVAQLTQCNFAKDYTALIDVIKGVGPEPGVAPEVHIMVPPPLFQDGAYNMNQTIINTVFPRLVPLIAQANADVVSSVIDVYTGMGGVPAPKWRSVMPPKCTLNSSWPPCKWFCDEQSCSPGQCHPNDDGCARLAQVVYDGLFPPAAKRKIAN